MTIFDAGFVETAATFFAGFIIGGIFALVVMAVMMGGREE